MFIRHQLDDDVDERSFRVGSFGFGDFIQNVTVQRAFLQVGDTGTYDHCDLCVCRYLHHGILLGRCQCDKVPWGVGASESRH